ncbi:beta-ketoacyl synthase domain-containing protein [Colletotrichum acutatum]|uniref:Beta-ketoacyl synthase domain-containing protein n=1 Tax=Glomerella acutata TaxID=27357 RepID=A0AAD8XE63_GLOAC|nr:beta-ketoacyl synthase domain-containing protein [Colletotrichum acutatum]KAK1723031.1 beta-ketoacyl synthase domain-containing protein [Colletotrichum acutatum]
MINSTNPAMIGICNENHQDSCLYEPIAIIGMGMRLPGRVYNATDYWDLLINGRSGRCRVPKSRYNVDTWYGREKAAHAPSEFGYFLDDINLAHVDPSFWSFTKQEAELMDPRQRLFLEVAYEALENSGSTKWRGHDIGVYVGTMGEDWSQLESRDGQSLQQVRPDVYGDYIIANRASYEFDLTGPSVVVRTACSASLVALHQACQDLHSGDCSSAIVGGVNLILSPKDTIIMQQNGVLSPSTACKSFDAEADGFARGEGISAIYIKKVSDAVRDGNPIRAVVRSTCTAGNGRTPGLTTPNPDIHERLMRRGHKMAGVTDLSKTAMVECHGTGTLVGDPLEVSAVANIWGDHGIYIGSVKPNIGHGEGASGLSSVIKMVLALENSTIPPNINFKTPNPRIPWKSAKLKVPTEPVPWPTDRDQRVSVNSFGIGGSNAHVLLESASCFGLSTSTLTNGLSSGPGVSRHQLLPLSAKHPKSIAALSQKVQSYLGRSPESLGDVAHSLASHRETHPYRAFCVTNGSSPLQISSVVKATTLSPDLVWVFTGQGAQWAQMGKELLEQEGLFKDRIDAMDGVLAGLPDPPPWTLRELLSAPKGESRLHEAEFSQPCLVAIQVALVDLLRSWDVTPAAVVGHSSGETAAAYAAGAITAEEAILIAYHRGQITRLIKAAHNGSMAAVGLGRKQIERFLRPGVIIGCDNSPSNVTLSGESNVLEEILLDLSSKHPDVLARKLRVECGYHSHHMKTAAADFTSRLEGLLQNKEPRIPFYSSVTGEKNTDMSHTYWVRNVISPVLFNTAVQGVLDDFKSPIFVEIGPHAALAGPVRQILSFRNMCAQYTPTLVRNQDAVSAVLKTGGELWVASVNIDMAAVNPPGQFLTDIPTYPWHYDEEYWKESRLSRSWRFRTFDHHELLGSRVEEISDACPAWRCILRLEDVPWLQEHVIRDKITFPASGFISMIGEALRQLHGSLDFTLKAVSMEAALTLDEKTVEVVTILNPTRSKTSSKKIVYDFSISSLADGSEVWVSHIFGQCRSGSDRRHAVPDMPALPRQASANSFYNTWKRHGLNYGPNFRGLSNVSSHVSEARAFATLDGKLAGYTNSPYSIHPVTLDTSMHVAMISESRGLERNVQGLVVPTYIQEVYVARPTGQINVVASADNEAEAIAKSNIIGVSDGQVVIEISGLEVTQLGGVISDKVADDPHAGVVLKWMPDINFTKATQLFRRREMDASYNVLNELVLACIVDLRTQLQFLPATQPHFVNYKSWLDASYRKAMTGQYADVLNAFDIATMNHKTRLKAIGKMTESCKRTPALDASVSIFRVHTFGADCFSGLPHAIKPLAQPSHFDGAANLIANVDFTDFVRLLGHKNPGLRVLHIGARESDGLLSKLLCSDDINFPYGSYVYTGASSKPPKSLRNRYESAPAVTYKQLVIDIDPSSQGFSEESFDLIISEPTLSSFSNVSIINMRRLLSPRGHLILQHANPESNLLRFAYGLSTNFDLGYGSLGCPDILLSQLSHAGFDNASTFTFAGEHSRVTVATPFADFSKMSKASIICQDPSHHLVVAATRDLESHGICLQFFSLGQELPYGQAVVCLLDLEGPFLHDMDRIQWENLKKSLSSAQDERFLWITAASQIHCKDPRYSLTLGVTRSIRRELSIDLVTLELESYDTSGWSAMTTVFESLGNRSSTGGTKADSEYAFSGGSIQICRFHSVKVSDDLRERCEGAPKVLRMKKPGILQSLTWEESEATMLSDDHVEVSVKAVSLNAEDSKISSAHFTDSSSGCAEIGLEGSGVVTAVGSKTCRFRLGDRVAFNLSSSLATTIIVPETLCAEIPHAMTFEEAASYPYSYSTVLYGLMELGRLRKDQTLLIHSTPGALGLAAIQVSKMVGAEIFCTAENTTQARYLQKIYGIPSNRILSSDITSFVPNILHQTNSRGVDIVFSTRPESIQESWACLKPFGTMVQVRHGGGQMADILKSCRNRTLVNIDLEELRVHQPEESTRLLEQAFLFHKFGLNKPSQPITVFPASDMLSAFKYLQSEGRIGQVVIKMPESKTELQALPLRRRMALRSDRTYVIVGGLGGLGQATGRFLIEKGARHLIFFSRSAKDVAHSAYFNELEFLGCMVQAVPGSVNEMTDVVRMVDSATTPIAGVLHAAMVLQDVHFADMTFEQWHTTVSPKVQGTWNLHYALQAQRDPLDFFFLFSSLSGLGGQIGQANYAAANAFLDAFVQYRHSQGLVCSVLDIGIMEDIGVLARETNRLEALRSTSQHCLHEQDLLDAMELMINRSQAKKRIHTQALLHSIEGYLNSSQLAIGMRSSSSINRTGWQQDPRAGFLAKTVSVDGPIDQHKSESTLKGYLQRCVLDPSQLESDEAKHFLAGEIGAALRGFMMRQDEEVDLTRPLQTDSLVTVELRNWLRQKVGVVLNVLEMKSAASVIALGGLVAMRLSAVYRNRVQDVGIV